MVSKSIIGPKTHVYHSLERINSCGFLRWPIITLTSNEPWDAWDINDHNYNSIYFRMDLMLHFSVTNLSQILVTDKKVDTKGSTDAAENLRNIKTTGNELTENYHPYLGLCNPRVFKETIEHTTQPSELEYRLHLHHHIKWGFSWLNHWRFLGIFCSQTIFSMVDFLRIKCSTNLLWI